MQPPLKVFLKQARMPPKSCPETATLVAYNVAAPASATQKPIYKASSRPALLAALAGCIEGHESFHNASFRHRDISINNLLINNNGENPSWSSFLIVMDLAITKQWAAVSGAS